LIENTFDRKRVPANPSRNPNPHSNPNPNETNGNGSTTLPRKHV